MEIKKHYRISTNTHKLIAVSFIISLTLFVSHASGQSGPYSIVWTDIAGVSYSGNTVTKTAPDAWGNAGASSLYYLHENTDGWMEYTVEVINQRKAFGLTTYNLNHYHGSITYAFSFGTDSKVYLWLSGAQLTTSPIAINDVLRIERIGSTIYYKKNGATLHTITGGLTGALIPDIAMYASGGVFSNIKASFGLASTATLHWVNTTGVSISGGDMLRNVPYTTGWGESAAFSQESLPAGHNGWVEATLYETESTRIIGLASSDLNSSNTIEFGIQLSGNGNTHIVEDGVTIGYVGKYVSGSVARVAREGSQVKYYMDNVLKHTSSKSSSGKLFIDLAILNPLATLKDITANNFILDTIPDVPSEVPWDQFAGIQVDGLNNLVKTSASGYGNAGAVSTATLPAGTNGWVQMVAAETNTSRMIGLTEHDVDDGTNIDFAIEFNAEAEVHVVEDDIQKDYLGDYTEGTVARVSREGNQVRYYLNGDLKATSQKTSTSSLIVDAAIDHTYGTITGLQVSTAFTNTVGGPLAPLKDFYDSLGGANWTNSWPVSGGWPTYLTIDNVGGWYGFYNHEYPRLYLEMENNNLSGVVPSSLWKIPMISIIRLSHNNITGLSMNSEDLAYYDNWEIDLSHNQIISLPEAFGELPYVTLLYLQNNQLTSLPESIGNMETLITLDLRHNQLTSLPESFSSEYLSYVYGLGIDLSYNNFSTFPLSGYRTGMSGLNLANNSLTSLPEGIGSFGDLTDLDLSHNQLTSLPESFGQLSLGDLNLSYNQLESLPESFEFTGYLLDLSNNNLTSLPSTIDAYHLDVSNNQLDFSTLETLISQGTNVSYGPQQNIVDVTEIAVKIGSQLVIPARDPGQYSSIDWEKKQPNGSWINVNALNDDPTQETYTINVTESSDLGVYRWKMTNTLVTGITIQSGEITVKDAVTAFLDKLAFLYKYDARRRMTHKKVPGADWVYMVYDNRDRLVMTQDGNQRNKPEGTPNEWTFTKYDALNRPVLTGIYKDIDKYDQADMQEEVNDFYTAAENNADEWFEVRGTAVHGYSNQSFPKVEVSEDYLTVTYYDDYEFKSLIADSEFDYKKTEIAGQYQNPDPGATVAFGRVIGQVTGTKVKVLGEENKYLWQVSYYDDKYRVVQTVAHNDKSGIDRTTNVYDFVGKVLKTHTRHTAPGIPLVGTTGIATTRTFEYDHAGRLIKTRHKLNEDDSVLLAANEYNELGQLVTKKLHSEDNGSTFKQHEDYRYNIRGWLTRINNADLNTNDGGPKDFFGMEFGYNNDLGIGDFTPQYNGNISATKWSANLGLALPYLNEHTQRAYKFSYDPLNRLREANYAAKTGSWSESLGYREAMDYDLNGNILSLYRNSETGTPIDWLTYDYGDGANRSNQLKSITDQGVITKGFKDGNTTGDDFVYDGNGNLIQDKNKGLGNIKYNSYLNLKEQIDKSTGEKIKYIYNADGVKLAEEIYAPGAQTPSKRTDYVGPFVYENDTLKFIQHEEGKIIIPKPESTDPSPEYQYQVKDHLDNVRLTFTTKQKTDEFKATMEDTGVADYSNPRVQEMAYFGNLFETEIRNVNQWLNHTSNVIGNAVYLDGSEAKTIGPYTMLKVYPGDTVRMEVFGKYENESSYSTMPLVTFLVALMNPVQTAAISVDGGAGLTTSSLMDGLIPFLTSKGSSSTTPAVYLNYILFDKDFKVVDLGFDRIDESSGFDPLEEATVSFDKMELERIIDRVGYLYVYVSNESEGTRVWLDDLTITYGQSPIVQFEDYYPFGLSQSETAFERGNDKYKGMVTTDGIGLKDLGFRQYDAATGRFDAVDPLAELQLDQSTYQYAGNNPVSQVDVLGLDQDDHDKDKRKKRKEERMVNGKKVKVHNGFENRQQRRSERAANQRERQQARADRREQRQQRREEHAKNKEEGGKDGAQASNNSSDQGSESGDPDEPTFVYIDVNGPPYPDKDKDERGLPKNIVNSVNNGSPDRVFSYSDDVVTSETNNTSSTLPISVVRSYEIARKNPDVERTRQYLYRNHPINEARALYQRMLVARNGNYQSTLLKQNIAVLANTTTSDDVIDPAREEIKCPTCPSGWEDLIEFKPPKSIYDKFAAENKRLTPSIPNVPGQGSPWVPTWYVHEIENARGSKINLDKYSVTITELPTVNGDQMTIDELFNHIRVYLDDFKSDEIADFFDYPDAEFAESENWETNDYVGVIKVFRAHLNAVMFDDLAVVASEQTENTWIFSTIHSPATENHAVSGNRQFGFTDNGDGTYTIFTRGADVATGVIDVLAGEAIFAGAEELWNNFLDNIIEFVNQNSGSAGDKQITSNRYDLE